MGPTRNRADVAGAVWRGGILDGIYSRSRRFADTKGCSEWEGRFSSKLVIDTVSMPNRYFSSASPKVHVSGSQRTGNSSTHVDRRPCLIRLGSERANIWRMVAVSPGVSLPLSGSTVVWIFLFCPGLLGGMWSVIFAGRVGPPYLRMETRCAQYCSLNGELLESRVHH